MNGAASSDGFERLDPRVLVAASALVGLVVLVSSVPAVLAFRGEGMPWPAAAALALGGALVVTAAAAGVEYLRWRATRFRVTADRFELLFHLVLTRRRSLSRDRIRTVDISANPVQRLCGLAAVVIGTGQHAGSGEADIKLDAVSRQRAEDLRVQLLSRTPAAATAGAAAAVAGESAGHESPGNRSLAVLDWSWVAYAPLSLLTPALAGAAAGAVLNVSGWFGVDEGAAAELVAGFVRAAALAGVLVILGGALTAGAVGAVLLFVEMWWGYRLEREPGGTLRLRRGLFTTRSLSLEERRLRGVEIVEPLGVRLARAARVDAVATGMRQDTQGRRPDQRTLLPAAPRAVAERVAAAVVHRQRSPTAEVQLVRHPVAALHRRVRWALAAVVAVVAAAAVPAVVLGSVFGDVADEAVGGMLAALPVVVAVLAAPGALLLARDAYRNLGHGISGEHLVRRVGTVRRSTVALQRSGVIGWTVRQSYFQRRVGLVTLIATTAAGDGAYAVPDADAAEALCFADEAVPGLLAPFLEVTEARG